MAEQGSIGIGNPVSYRKLTDHQASPSGIKRLGLPIARTWKQVQSQTYPQQYWNYPCAMGDARGFVYWKKGSNALFKIADAEEQPKAETGWRWIRPGIARLRWAVSAGENTVSLSLIQSDDHAPRPALRILANAALGIAETVASAGPATGTAQTLTLAVTATEAGVITLQLEWWAMVESSEVVWEKLIVS